MTKTERAVLASLRSVAPSKAVDIGHRCSLDHETLYGALVQLEAKGLARIAVDYKNPSRPYKQQAMWETA